MVTELERKLLSVMVFEREPFHALYTDLNRESSHVAVEAVIEALVKLAEMGLIRAYRYEDGRITAVTNLTSQHMIRHVLGRSDNELMQYPSDGREYWFELTPEGRTEEDKE